MINLQSKPFNLTDGQLEWVQSTLAGMTLEEKVGQLFCPISYSSEPGYMEHELLRFHIGGIMFKTAPAQELRKALGYMQEHSKIPLLVGANLEYGSPGFIKEGTYFGQQMAVGASGNAENAYRLGVVSCKEAAALGCNMAFAPVADIDMNWRNPITNVRTYSNDADTVLAMCKAYKRGADEAGVAVSAKHFPGDGVDEVDQHLLVSVNSLSREDWDATFGKVYSGMIAEGAQIVMAGHIALPAYQGEQSKKLVPATLSPELLHGLLREKLGFNGLIMSDATPMVGFASAMKRADAVPMCIAAGCDMFLFNKSLEEDYHFMLDGIARGILTEARVDEAVTRILALKASLGLAEHASPAENDQAVIGCEAHHQWARQCADEAITLVKDTQSLLPISAAKTRRVLLEVLGDTSSNEQIAASMQAKLEREGFVVTLYEREDFSSYQFGVKPFTDKFDMVMYLGNIENASNKTTNRINWYTFWGNGNNVPWFVEEVPTLFASLANPYHLVDVPMMRTYINCYSGNEETLDALVEKLMGRSAFKGKSPVDPFLGKDYLRY